MALECCPVNFVYVDANGAFDDPGFGTGVISNANDPAFLDKCNRIVYIQATNEYRAINEPIDPIECPCCEVGYTYSSYKALCLYDLDITITAPPIPCIPCICPDPPAPRECEVADRGLERSIDATDGKLCDDCNVDENYGPSGGITCFIPQQDLDPIIAGFKLRNKNFM